MRPHPFQTWAGKEGIRLQTSILYRSRSRPARAVSRQLCTPYACMSMYIGICTWLLSGNFLLLLCLTGQRKVWRGGRVMDTALEGVCHGDQPQRESRQECEMQKGSFISSSPTPEVCIPPETIFLGRRCGITLLGSLTRRPEDQTVCPTLRHTVYAPILGYGQKHEMVATGMKKGKRARGRRTPEG